MSRFVELTRIVGGYIVVNIEEVLTISETNTKREPIPEIDFKGTYSVITFKKPEGMRLLVRESLPDIKKKYASRNSDELW